MGGDSPIQKPAASLGSTTEYFQPGRRIGEKGKGRHKVSYRNAIAVYQQLPLSIFSSIACRQRSFHPSNSSGSLDEKVFLVQGYQVRNPDCPKGLRRSQIIDRFEKIGLALSVGPDEEIDLVVKR